MIINSYVHAAGGGPIEGSLAAADDADVSDISGEVEITPWTPADTTTDIWLDAEDTGTLTIVSDEVSQWSDKSGNARDFAQPTAGQLPAHGSVQLNGVDVLTFDGSNDRLTCATNLAGLAQNVAGLSLFAVRRFLAEPATVQHILAVGTGTLGALRSILGGGIVAQRNTTGSRRLDADSFQSISGSVAIGTGWNVVGGVFDFANTDAFLYVDGTQQATNAAFQTAGNTSNTTPLIVTLGCNPAQTGAFFAGDLAEVIIVNGAVTTDIRQRIEGYLAWKWGLEASLPVGHPWTGGPPTV
jgi:hypothetical protein